MTEENKLQMSLEEYLRGKLNVPSGKGASFDYNELAEESEVSSIQGLVAKGRSMLGSISKYADSKGINLEPNIAENFSIGPMLYEQSPGYEGILKMVREYYEAQNMTYDEEASTPSKHNCDPPTWFETSLGKRFYVTYTPTLLGGKRMELLFTASFVK